MLSPSIRLLCLKLKFSAKHCTSKLDIAYTLMQILHSAYIVSSNDHLVAIYTLSIVKNFE